MKRQLPILAVIILLLTTQSGKAQLELNADDWTQWRGKNRDGVADIKWPDTLSTEKLVEERTIALQPSYRY